MSELPESLTHQINEITQSSELSKLVDKKFNMLFKINNKSPPQIEEVDKKIAEFNFQNSSSSLEKLVGEMNNILFDTNKMYTYECDDKSKINTSCSTNKSGKGVLFFLIQK